MGSVDTFGVYVRHRLEHWGHEFALCRDCDYLGHQSKNMLQVLIEHRGEMPGRAQGYKPLEVSLDALQIEQVVADIARGQVPIACALRAYYCGSGRRTVERYETANLLLTSTGHKPVNRTRYLAMHDVGFAQVRGFLTGLAQAA